MKQREKRLSTFIIEKFILFSVVAITLFSIFFNVMVIIYSKSEILNMLSAKELFSSDYESTDTTILESLNGWIEVLDENNHVIFTKGDVGEVKTSYTQAELLEQASFNTASKPQGFTIAGIIKISAVKTIENPSYIANYHTFTGLDGLTYTGVVKIPADRLDISYTLINAEGQLKGYVAKTISILLLGVIIILVVCTYYYSCSIQKHLAKPNKALVEGLEAIIQGDYNHQLNFVADYEYKQIKSAFTYLTEKLSQAKTQREQYEKERQQLFSNMAHDLKTPITSIKGYAQALKDGLVDKEKQQDYYCTIEQKAQQMTELINRLLSYNKLDQPEYKLTFKSVDFCEFLRLIIVEMLDKIEQYDQQIEINIPDDSIMLSIDELEMERVIINLMMNAIKHNPPNTIISVSLIVKDETVILDIKDNGIPISKDMQQQLFQPFVCCDESRTTKNGNGLGLSICEKIIKKHNADLQFHQVNEQEKYFRVILVIK